MSVSGAAGDAAVVSATSWREALHAPGVVAVLEERADALVAERDGGGGDAVAALRAAAVDVEVLRAPDLGHLLNRNAPGFAGIGEEYGMPQGFDPAVVDAIVAWVRAH